MPRWSFCGAAFACWAFAAAGQAPRERVAAWANAWVSANGSEVQWDRVETTEGVDPPSVGSESVVFRWPDAFVRRTMKARVVGGDLVEEVSGFTSDGRFFLMEPDTGQYLGGAKQGFVDILMASDFLHPEIIARFFLFAEESESTSASTFEADERSGVVTWIPQSLSGVQYEFVERGGVFRLVARRTSTESQSVSTDVEYLYDGEDSFTLMPTKLVVVTSVDGVSVNLPGADEPVTLSQTTTHDYTRRSFRSLTPADSPFLDPTGTTHYVASTGEILDPDGNVVARVEPVKATSGTFRWWSFTLIGGVALAGVGGSVWLYRRLR